MTEEEYLNFKQEWDNNEVESIFSWIDNQNGRGVIKIGVK